jgi:hypothetical protein
MGECKNEHMCDEIAERSFNYQLDSYLKKLEEEYFIDDDDEEESDE